MNHGWTRMHTDQEINSATTNTITEAIIGCAMKVSNILGVGFIEKVYENALVIELARAGFGVEQQKSIKVTYEGVIVGDFQLDMVVNGAVIVEMKAAKMIDEIHKAQLLNYLKATGFKVGLILNFGASRLGIKRMVLS